MGVVGKEDKAHHRSWVNELLWKPATVACFQAPTMERFDLADAQCALVLHEIAQCFRLFFAFKVISSWNISQSEKIKCTNILGWWICELRCWQLPERSSAAENRRVHCVCQRERWKATAKVFEEVFRWAETTSAGGLELTPYAHLHYYCCYLLPLSFTLFSDVWYADFHSFSQSFLYGEKSWHEKRDKSVITLFVTIANNQQNTKQTPKSNIIWK